MPDKASITDVVFAAMQELNEQMLEENPLNISDDTVLFGQDGQLDSMGLVNLIVLIEEGIVERFNLNVMLADEKAMSAKTSPFRTVGTLTGYIAERLDGHSDA